MEFAELIQQITANRNGSMLAKQAGISSSCVHMMKSGKYIPTVYILKKIAKTDLAKQHKITFNRLMLTAGYIQEKEIPRQTELWIVVKRQKDKPEQIICACCTEHMAGYYAAETAIEISDKRKNLLLHGGKRKNDVWFTFCDSNNENRDVGIEICVRKTKVI